MDSKALPDLSIFALFDVKRNSYRDPILASDEWDIIRDYERMCRDPKAGEDILVSNAEDFQLYSLGHYHRSTGLIKSWEPRHVVNLIQIKGSVDRKQRPHSVDLNAAQAQDAVLKQIPQ